MTDNGAATVRLLKAQRRLGDILANWPKPPSPILYSTQIPQLSRLPSHLISHIISFLHFSNEKRGAILIAAILIANYSKKIALNLLEPIRISPSASTMLQLLDSMLKALELNSVADFRNFVADDNQRCRRLTCGALFTRRKRNFCKFHTGIESRDHQQHALCLTRANLVGRYRRHLSLAPYACCGSTITNEMQCRLGHHIGDIEDALIFGHAVISGIKLDFRRPYNDEATLIALQYLIGWPNIQLDEFEWGSRIEVKAENS